MSAINFDQPSAGNVNSSQDALSVKNTAAGSAIVAESIGFDGVRGVSHSNAHAGISAGNVSNGGFGVWAGSQGGEAVHGESKFGVGIAGYNTAGGYAIVGQTTGTNAFGSGGTAVSGIGRGPGDGVHGEADAGTGVQGLSISGAGVQGLSTSGSGVWASGKPAGHFAGDVEVTGDIRLLNADCAEDFDTDETKNVEPGTVMVIDLEGVLRQSDKAYDKRVAGVISGAGGLRPGIILNKVQSHSNRIPIALLGKVYCKVDARHSPVAVGDLLTTSPTPGHAMKADDPLKAFGSVIGKALRPLQSGQDLIPILIALQ